MSWLLQELPGWFSVYASLQIQKITEFVAGDCLQGGNRPTKYLVKMKAVLLLVVVKLILVFTCHSLVSVLHCCSTSVVSDLVFCLS